MVVDGGDKVGGGGATQDGSIRYLRDMKQGGGDTADNNAVQKRLACAMAPKEGGLGGSEEE